MPVAKRFDESSTTQRVHPWLIAHLVCPVDREPLAQHGSELRCQNGHEYLIVDGVPILLHPAVSPEVDVPALDRGNLENLSHREVAATGVDPYVQSAIGATNGIMYRALMGKLSEYPIPDLPLPEGHGKSLLDIGCNWGRWCVAAARRGYFVVGMDPNPEAVFAATRVARQLGIEACFVVADGRHLPFASSSFDQVWSYSVIQHFAKTDARACLAEVSRVMKESGAALIQMANGLGLRGMYHQARRGFAPGARFDVRYWTPGELKKAWEQTIGPSRLSVDGFLTINPQQAEARLLPLRFRMVVKVSYGLKALSTYLPPLLWLADSVFISARKRRVD